MEFHPNNKVEVIGAPGYVGTIPGLESIPVLDGRGDLAVIVTEGGEAHVVPAKFVHRVDSPEAAAYRAEWATKADRNPRDVYIPEALR